MIKHPKNIKEEKNFTKIDEEDTSQNIANNET